jgi:hypothetical protein
MRRSHVEQRSRKIIARQYVSETHDHKPDVGPRIRIENKTKDHRGWTGISSKSLPVRKTEATGG